MLEAPIIFGCYPLVKNQDPIDYDNNMDDLYDYLTQAMHSSLWEWLDQSRSFFWRWTSLCTKESRGGACTFHLYFTLPKLISYSLPIKRRVDSTT